MTKYLQQFKLNIDKEEFFEAHEALEEIWFPRRFDKQTSTKLLKGFINAAVSFELIKRGRVKQSKKVWATYLKYRQLLFKLDSKDKNNFYILSRDIDIAYKDITLKIDHL